MIANGNEAAKVDKMIAVADGIPSDGWTMTTKVTPSHNVGCIAFDNACHSLIRVCETPGSVDRAHMLLCVADGEGKIDLRMFDR